MRVASYFRPGPGNFQAWVEEIGTALPRAISSAAMICPIEQREPFEPVADCDIAYLAAGLQPTRRPARFVYSLLSDWDEEWLPWLQAHRPDFVGLVGGEVPELLARAVAQWGGRVEPFPWFYSELPPLATKGGGAVFAATVSPTYPERQEMLDYVAREGLPVGLAVSPTFNAPAVPHSKYLSLLGTAKYLFVSPSPQGFLVFKYIEGAAHGCALIGFDSPATRAAGFEVGKTIIGARPFERLREVIASDEWVEMGARARALVAERHLAKHRAARLLELAV